MAWLRRVTAIGQLTNHSAFTLTAERNGERRFEALNSGTNAKNQRQIRVLPQQNYEDASALER